jgi:hypothetical protein
MTRDWSCTQRRFGAYWWKKPLCWFQPTELVFRSKELVMAICDTCGNDYDKAFTITRGDQSATFDSFECAIHAMAPTCAHCGCRIIGHGTESGGVMYCCANCARGAGDTGAVDRS